MTRRGAPRPLPPGGDPRVGIIEGWELRHIEKQEANAGAWKGLFFVVAILVVLVVGGWLAARPILGSALTGLFEENPGMVRVPVVSDLLAAEFADRVNAPAGTAEDEVTFVVQDGQTIDEILAGLVERGLVADEQAFMYEITKDQKDQLIRPGEYTMTARFTPAQVVQKLAFEPDPPTPKTVLALRDGWRIEQIAAYVQQQKEVEEIGLEIDVARFVELALEPAPELRDEFRSLRQAPRGNPLEGFLAGGVYEVEIDITADELLRLLLTTWEEQNGDLVAQARRADVDFYEALRIAALVEREATLDRERARIAGVYWNRIDPRRNGPTGGLMQADPTVVYAADTATLRDRPVGRWDEYLFWDTLGVPLVTVDVPNDLSSFQTYRNPGLPKWPITTPSRKSIQAAISPNRKKGFLFFVSCPGEDKHTFAKTQTQHERNVRKCGLPT